MAEVFRLKTAEKGTKTNKEALHDMVMRRLARYVESEGDNTLEIPNTVLKHGDDGEEYEDI